MMTPVAARIATRAVARRQFSIMANLRAAGRAMEAHPFERLPAAQKSAPADWGKQFKRVGSQAIVFFPGFALLLGWPALAKAAFDGKVGAY